jgi:hypothetical protein
LGRWLGGVGPWEVLEHMDWYDDLLMLMEADRAKAEDDEKRWRLKE